MAGILPDAGRTPNDRQETFVSVVVWLRNDATILSDVVHETVAVLRENYRNFELILVDDDSDDNTPNIIHELLLNVEGIRYLCLTRHHGIDLAIFAGLDLAIGDYVVVMLPDRDPPRLIPDLVRVAQNGVGIVRCSSPSRPGYSWLDRILAALFYGVIVRLLRMRIDPDEAYFRVFSRGALNSLLRVRVKARFLRYMSTTLGYTTKTFPYQPIQRYEISRPRRLIFELNRAASLMLSSSLVPLRLVTWLGLLGGLINFLYIFYILGIYLFKSHVAEGWITTSTQSAVMFLLLFIVLAVFGEYLGIILEETRDRPLYFIREERISTLEFPAHQQRNVIREPAD